MVIDVKKGALILGSISQIVAACNCYKGGKNSNDCKKNNDDGKKNDDDDDEKMQDITFDNLKTYFSNILIDQCINEYCIFFKKNLGDNFLNQITHVYDKEVKNEGELIIKVKDGKFTTLKTIPSNSSLKNIETNILYFKITVSNVKDEDDGKKIGDITTNIFNGLKPIALNKENLKLIVPTEINKNKFDVSEVVLDNIVSVLNKDVDDALVSAIEFSKNYGVFNIKDVLSLEKIILIVDKDKNFIYVPGDNVPDINTYPNISFSTEIQFIKLEGNKKSFIIDIIKPKK